MTTKTAAKPAAKKDKSKAAPKGAQIPKTGDLALSGGHDGKTLGLDNKTVIKEPVPGEVVSAAKSFAEAKDRVEYHNKDAKEKGAILLDLMLKHSVSSKTKVRVETDSGTRFISLDDVVELKVEKAAKREGFSNN